MNLLLSGLLSREQGPTGTVEDRSPRLWADVIGMAPPPRRDGASASSFRTAST